MQTFRKKVVVEAVQYTGANEDEIAAFAGRALRPLANLSALTDGGLTDHQPRALVIATLEGNMTAQVGDWIIRGVRGECYPVKDLIFRDTYEAVEDRP
jgi:hypothetical protein